MRVSLATAITAGFSLIVSACNQSERAEATVSSKSSQASQDDAVGYERGEWWQHDLGDLILGASHILIAHSESRPSPELVHFSPTTRSKADALRLAWELSRMLASTPERFAATARQYSDDPGTAEAGGSLGAFSAAAVPPVFVDALGHLKEGQVSRPVETDEGYHVLRRLPAPAELHFGLARIVIKFAGASGWRRTDRDVVSHTRQEAREMAQMIRAKLEIAPDSFGRLAREYSESDEAPNQGELGVWSTYDAHDLDFMMLARAADLPVGGISAPFEIGSGIYIVQRRPVREWATFAASVVTIGHDASQIAQVSRRPGRSVDEAKSVAERLAKELSASPDQFDARAREACDGALCGLTAWSTGHGLADLERAVQPLDIHGVTRTPIASPIGFLIVRKEDSATYHPPEAPKPVFAFPLFPRFDTAVASPTTR
jgi:hypothetical protein